MSFNLRSFFNRLPFNRRKHTGIVPPSTIDGYAKTTIAPLHPVRTTIASHNCTSRITSRRIVSTWREL